ncbi:MAG TPA: hypothetical protein VHT73_02670 [Thermodesulfobacteriota bacterium]|nr:hypothetical protein [Thermodesulfobacteriota bacterium]
MGNNIKFRDTRCTEIHIDAMNKTEIHIDAMNKTKDLENYEEGKAQILFREVYKWMGKF